MAEGERECKETRRTLPSFMLVSAYCEHYWKAAGIKMHIKCRINYKLCPPFPAPPTSHTHVYLPGGGVSAGASHKVQQVIYGAVLVK